MKVALTPLSSARDNREDLAGDPLVHFGGEMAVGHETVVVRRGGKLVGGEEGDLVFPEGRGEERVQMVVKAFFVKEDDDRKPAVGPHGLGE